MSETRPRYLVHLALFVATVLTTTAQGAAYVHHGPMTPLWDGLHYSIPLLAILVSHEMGHYVAARIHGVPASLPYFIPLPPPIGLLGTMGAVIMQSGTTDRRKLIDIGAAGPLAGLVVAIPILTYGLTLSEVRPLTGIGTQEGNSLAYALLKRVTKGEWLPGGGRDVMMHPTAWAGWAGLLLTMLNLLPVGQLDGGHVATAYFGNRYQRVGRLVHAALPVLALGVLLQTHGVAQRELAGYPAAAGQLSAELIATQAALPWAVWFALLFLMKWLSGGQYHPPVSDARLPRNRALVFWITCVTFVLIFMPVPLRFVVGSQP